MAQAVCPICNHYITVPNIQDRQSSKCQFCRELITLYKCYSCMKVSAFAASGGLPQSCPRCNTAIRSARGFGAVVPVQVSALVLHNDEPPLTGETHFKPMDRLVFRGARVSYKDLETSGFKAVLDPRFPRPCIIRDCWKEKKVTTRMQTKSVLAWSKSFTKAFEYGFGSIGGGLDGAVPGNLYFAWVQKGVDVAEEVGTWEKQMGLPAIDKGAQKEVLCPTLPKRRILASWELTKGSGFGRVVIKKRTIYKGDFPTSVIGIYEYISANCPEKEFNFYDICEVIDKKFNV